MHKFQNARRTKLFSTKYFLRRRTLLERLPHQLR